MNELPTPLFTLVRVAVLPPGAFGVLLYGPTPFAVTLERTYTVDSSDTVKIPPGRYECKRTVYIKHGYQTYEVFVPGHSRILLHKGNVEEDSEGCILVAESYGELRGQPAILDSRGGFSEFMSLAGGRDRFILAVE